MQFNPQDFISPVAMLRAASNTAAPSVVVVDMWKFKEVLLVFDAGTFTGDQSAAIQFNDCSNADGTTGATAITGAVFPATTTANDVAIYFGRLQTLGLKRYLSATITSSGTGTAPYSVVALRMWPKDTVQTLGTDTYTFNISSP